MTEFVDAIKNAAAGIAPFLKPDEDWMPTLFLETANGMGVVDVSQVPMKTAKQKDRFTTVIVPKIVSMAKAKRFALLMTIWRVSVAAADAAVAEGLERGLERIDDHPDRIEAVLIYAFSEDDRFMVLADITRSPDAPPTLGEWSEPARQAKGRYTDMWSAL